MPANTIERPVVEAPIAALFESERAKALSKREWKFRLAGYGFAVREEGDEQVVSCLSHGVELGVLPKRLC